MLTGLIHYNCALLCYFLMYILFFLPLPLVLCKAYEKSPAASTRGISSSLCFTTLANNLISAWQHTNNTHKHQAASPPLPYATEAFVNIRSVSVHRGICVVATWLGPLPALPGNTLCPSHPQSCRATYFASHFLCWRATGSVSLVLGAAGPQSLPLPS